MNFIVPIECPEGHQYLLKFTDCENLPIELDMKVVDISLSSDSEMATINNIGTLNKITTIILNFLYENDVVLYYYCSKDVIIQRKNRGNLSPQQYRSKLFSALFDKIAKKHTGKKFINKPVVLRDKSEGDHYLHFIAKSIYSDKMDEYANHINKEFEK